MSTAIQLYKTRNRRRVKDTNTQVLLNHSVNYLQNGKHFSDKLQLDGYDLAYHNFMKLAREEYGYISYFSHYSIEQVGNDFLRISGCPLDSESEWLGELVDKGYLKVEMRNAILIDYATDLSFDIMTQHAKKHVGQTIAQVLNAFKIPISKFDIIDNHLLKGDGSMELTPMTRIKDRNEIVRYINSYK